MIQSVNYAGTLSNKLSSRCRYAYCPEHSVSNLHCKRITRSIFPPGGFNSNNPEAITTKLCECHLNNIIIARTSEKVPCSFESGKKIHTLFKSREFSRHILWDAEKKKTLQKTPEY